MVNFPGSGLASDIVAVLRNGPITTIDLIETIQKAAPAVTPQGIYKSLRLLRAQGIVLVSKKEALLNQAWLRQLEQFTLLTEHAYRNPISDSGHFLQMRDGDRITYQFKNAVQTDLFWNHVLYLLFDAFPHVRQWYAYSSHSWFLIARRDDELVLHNELRRRGIQGLVTTGHRTALDRLVSKDFDGTLLQYYMRNQPFFPQRSNSLGIVLNIVGEYIIEAQYDRQTTDQIEQFYIEYRTITPANTAELEAIVSSPSRIRFTIKRNAAKAEKLRRSLGKQFYVKTSPANLK